MTVQKKKANTVHQNPKEFIRKTGARLRKRRKELGFTSHEDFAYDAGINRSQYGKYEAGKDMHLTTLLKVVNSLGLTLEEFFSSAYDPK
jgi:transcriptional regulator with XRE-family HTH domain